MAQTSHPGEYIKDELRVRNWSVRDLSMWIGCTESYLKKIVEGKKGVSKTVARGLAKAFGTTDEIWLELDRIHPTSQPVPKNAPTQPDQLDPSECLDLPDEVVNQLSKSLQKTIRDLRNGRIGKG